MQTNKILSAPLIDLIFDGRNKEYGAYELRATYERRIKKSLLITVSILAVSIGGAAIAGSMKKVERPIIDRGEVVITQVELIEKIEPIVEPERQQEEVPVKTEKFTDLVIVEDKDFDEPPPSMDDLKNAQIGTVTVDGEDFIGIATPPSEGVEKGIVVVPEKKEPEIFTSVEIDAAFKGNWRAFLERNLNAEVPINNNAPAGRYTVVMQFVVDANGNVSDIKALTSHGYGMEEEAIRVLRKATKWEPAIQNGNQVKAYRKQPITFDVQSE